MKKSADKSCRRTKHQDLRFIKMSQDIEASYLTPRLASFICLLVLLSLTLVEAAERSRASSNYLLFSSLRPTSLDTKLSELLQDDNHNHVSDTVNLSLANSVWRLMHDNALEFARQRVELVRPSAIRLLDRAQVSEPCRKSLSDTLDHLGRLETWAVQMYNSFGDFPAQGFIEGSHNSMGSYRQCVDVESNQVIGQAHYCSFQYQPVLPKRPRYHNILSPIEQLANFTSQNDVSIRSYVHS